MKIVCLQDKNDPTESSLPEGTIWCVYRYESGSYEGDGEAYCGTADGKIYETSLGHCSCYGAWESNDHGNPCEWSEVTKSELLEMHLAGEDARAWALRQAILPLIQ